MDFLIQVKRTELAKDLEYDDSVDSPTLTLYWPGGVKQKLRALDMIYCELKAGDSLNNFYVSERYL